MLANPIWQSPIQRLNKCVRQQAGSYKVYLSELRETARAEHFYSVSGSKCHQQSARKKNGQPKSPKMPCVLFVLKTQRLKRRGESLQMNSPTLE
ncbi:hypothetical protein EC919_117104 [Pseudomonas graminis]|nr:hypothetical protein EC919_117104 [Pseudomonas graminis]